MRSLPLTFVAAMVTLAAWLLPVQAAGAACVQPDQLPPAVTVTGVVTDVSAGGPGGLPGRTVTLRLDDGSTRSVELQVNIEGEMMTAEPYQGSVPLLGGRYRITGLGDGRRVVLSGCMPDAAVELLAAPPSTTVVATSPTTRPLTPSVDPRTKDDAPSPLVPVAIGLLIGVGTGGLLVARRRRRRLP